nr:hypothetical protein [Tanacetum cinerariifolium]
MSLRKKSLGILLMKKVIIMMMMKEMMVKREIMMMMMNKMMMIRKMKGIDKNDQEEGSNDEQARDEEEFIHPSLSTHAEEETRDEESFNPIPKTPENTDDEGNGEENLGMNVGREEGQDKEDVEDELYRDVNINLGRGVQMADVHTTQEFEDSHVTLTPSERLCDEAQKENDEFLKTIDENMQKIIKEQVKEQVKVQISKILPKIEQTVNEQLEAEVLTRSSNSSKTSYARNLYKALVEAYEPDKIFLDIYGDTVTLKRRRDDDANKDEEPFAGSDWGSKRRREGKEPESISAPRVKSTRKLLDGPTYELMKGSCKSLVELEFFLEEVYKATTDQLDWVNLEGASSRKYTTSITKTKAVDYGHIKWIEDLVPRTMWIQEPVSYDKHALWGISHWGRKHKQFYGFTVNRESARNVYSKRRIIAVTELKIVKWHNYKHLDWITVKADKSDSRRTLCFQRLSSNVYKKHRNPKACGRPSTRCRKLPKKLNLTRPDSYRSDLKRKEAYIAYSNPRGFIYQNKDKQNRLTWIDELHKLSDGTITDVRTALDDRLKGIRMKYLPHNIWRKSDKERAAAMIQAIDKRLKTRRIMRSLERFVGGRLYEGDFKMLQRTI